MSNSGCAYTFVELWLPAHCELGSESLLVILLPVLGKCFFSVNVLLSITLTISPVVLPPQSFKVQNAMYDQSYFESSLFSVRKSTIFSCSCCSKCCSLLLLVDFAIEKGSIMSSSLGETATMQICTHWPPRARVARATCGLLRCLLPSSMEFFLTPV